MSAVLAPITLDQHVLGRNKIGKRQWASYHVFLASDQGLSWLASLTQEETETLARLGWSKVPGGRAIDERFVAAWASWASSLPVAPPKSHMWSKGVAAAALILTFTA